MAKRNLVMIVHPNWKVEAGIVKSAVEYITKAEAIKRGIAVM